jgi:hypothetical protein
MVIIYRQDIVRKGELEIIEGWDERFDRRVSDLVKVANQVSYFLPIKKGMKLSRCWLLAVSERTKTRFYHV